MKIYPVIGFVLRNSLVEIGFWEQVLEIYPVIGCSLRNPLVEICFSWADKMPKKRKPGREKFLQQPLEAGANKLAPPCT